MQRALARKVRLEKFHLVAEHPPTLQVDILGMSGREGNGQQLHPRLFGGSAGLVIVATLAGGYHVTPEIDAALAEGLDMIPRKLRVPKLEPAVEAKMIVATKQGRVAERGNIMEIPPAPFPVVMSGSDNGVDFNLTQPAAFRIDPSAQGVERSAAAISHHTQVVEFRGLLVAQPLQWHAGNIGS